MCLHYGYDDAVWDLKEQYLVGTEMLVAPVLYEGATSVDVYFPRLSGSWVHIVSYILKKLYFMFIIYIIIYAFSVSMVFDCVVVLMLMLV